MPLDNEKPRFSLVVLLSQELLLVVTGFLLLAFHFEWGFGLFWIGSVALFVFIFLYMTLGLSPAFRASGVRVSGSNYFWESVLRLEMQKGFGELSKIKYVSDSRSSRLKMIALCLVYFVAIECHGNLVNSVLSEKQPRISKAMRLKRIGSIQIDKIGDVSVMAKNDSGIIVRRFSADGSLGIAKTVYLSHALLVDRVKKAIRLPFASFCTYGDVPIIGFHPATGFLYLFGILIP